MQTAALFVVIPHEHFANVLRENRVAEERQSRGVILFCRCLVHIYDIIAHFIENLNRFSANKNAGQIRSAFFPC